MTQSYGDALITSLGTAHCDRYSGKKNCFDMTFAKSIVLLDVVRAVVGNDESEMIRTFADSFSKTSERLRHSGRHCGIAVTSRSR